MYNKLVNNQSIILDSLNDLSCHMKLITSIQIYYKAIAMFVLAICCAVLPGMQKTSLAKESITTDVKVNNEKLINNVKVLYNPVVEQINVSFKLNKQSNVTIKLMDALGNEVLNLSNSVLESGLQTLSFETNGKVTPGFYFVRLSASNENIVKRISIR